MNQLFESKSENQNILPNLDEGRFEKLRRKNRKPDNLYCAYEDDKQIFRIEEDGQKYMVVDVEINYIDSNGDIYLLRKDESNLNGMWIYFLSGGKILIAYQENKDKPIKYCSWGYKKSSATTDKLSVFFKTTDDTWFVYLDAQHPEHTFFLQTERTEEWDDVENLYNLMKELLQEKGV